MNEVPARTIIHRRAPVVRLLCALMAGALSGVVLLAPMRSAAAQAFTRDADSVRIEVADARRMASVIRSLATVRPSDTAAFIDTAYLAKASPGLRVWADRYGVTGATIAGAIRTHPARYAGIEVMADLVVARIPEMRRALTRLQRVHPNAAFLPIWFFVGHHEATGLARPEGVLIAIEAIGDTSEIVPLVVHEMTHVQQALAQGLDTYRSIFGSGRSLLKLAIREGSAEFFAELVTGRQGNAERNRYGEQHEQELWPRFKTEMHNGEPGDWMFVGPTDPRMPTNLGYWVGYRIVKSYYARADDKAQAIRDILGVTDYAAFLERSGYDPT